MFIDDLMILGRHVSIGSSLANSIDIAKDLNCNAIQIFTRNPRGWEAKDLDVHDIEKFISARRSYKLEAAVSHMPYLPNLASPNVEVYNRSVDTLLDELDRCQRLEIDYLVLHLGSHLNKGAKDGAKRVIEAVSKACGKSERTMILLENQAGQKNSVGSKIDELVEIFDGIHSKRVGLCLDTCHAFAAGYDLRKEEVIDELVHGLGKDTIKVVHLNDARFGVGSLKDRHENIGFGEIGKGGISGIINNAGLKGKVFILETPEDKKITEYDELRSVESMLKR